MNETSIRIRTSRGSLVLSRVVGLACSWACCATILAGENVETNEPPAVVAITPAEPAVAGDEVPQPPESASERAAHGNAQPMNTSAEFAPGEGLRLNFRYVALDQVLAYVSRAAGIAITTAPNVNVKGKVNIWSAHSTSKEESLTLLESALADNGLSVVRNGRLLSIINASDARKVAPINVGTNHLTIPRNSEMVTEIIPVRSLSVTQLARDLAPLVETTLTAQESGNSIIMTDTQTNVRRIVEIVKKLDQVVSSVNEIQVFPLLHSDASTVAGLIKEMFPSTTGTTSNNGGGNAFGQFRGGPGGPGGPGGGFGGFGPQGGNNGGGAESSEGHKPSERVTAVADDHSNAVIVSAPETLMSAIASLVKSMDVDVQDITAVRVFHLKNADPGETVDLLSSLFPDESTSANGNSGFQPFGGFGPPGMVTTGTTTGTDSNRLKKMGKVLAVADRRTSSLVVTAAKSLMPQIEEMISRLDAMNDRKQKLFTFTLDHAQPQDVLEIMQQTIPSSSSSKSGASSTTSQNNPLLTRSQTLLNNQFSSSSTTLSGSSSAGRTSSSTTGR